MKEKFTIRLADSNLAMELSQRGVNVFGERVRGWGNGFVAELKKHAGQAFKGALEVTAPLHEWHFPFEEHTIDLFNDFWRDRPVELASFCLTQSKEEGRNVFTCSARLLFDLFCREMESGIENTLLRHVFAHELMHLSDWMGLNNFSEARTTSLRATFGEGLEEIQRYWGPVISPEWQLLNTLHGLRDEGIAELGARLFAHHAGFRADLDASATLLGQLMSGYFACLNEVDSVDKIAASIAPLDEALKSLKYHAGPCFVLSALAGAGVAIEPALTFLRNPSGGSPPSEHSALLLRKATSMDIGAFLKALMRPQDVYPWGALLPPEGLMKIFSILSLPEDPSLPRPNFLPELYRHSRTGDKRAFLDLLEDIIGSPMSDEEIEESWQAFAAETDNSDLSKRLREDAEKIRLVFHSAPSLLTRLLLTYVLDPEDLIHDRFPYVGKLDDCFVLEFGWHLLRQTGDNCPTTSK